MNHHSLFSSRSEAGRLLAGRIAQRGFRQPAVLALPGPGMEIGLEVARSLQAPLDVVVPSELGPEDGAPAWEEAGPNGRAAAAPDERSAALRARERAWRHGRPAIDLAGRTCLLADDGGSSLDDLRSALHRLRSARPRRIVLVAPVVDGRTLQSLEAELDGCIRLFEIGDPSEVDLIFPEPGSRSAEEVAELLDRAWHDGPPSG